MIDMFVIYNQNNTITTTFTYLIECCTYIFNIIHSRYAKHL